MIDKPMFNDPEQFHRMLGTMLAALNRWIEDDLPPTATERQLATAGGRHAALNMEETRALAQYLSSMLPTDRPANSVQTLRNPALFTPGPWGVAIRGERAYLMGRDAAGQWEVANLNLCMGSQSNANLSMLKHAPETLQSLLALLTARERGTALPWAKASEIAHAATSVRY